MDNEIQYQTLADVPQAILDTSTPSLLCRVPRSGQFRVDLYKAGIRTVKDLITFSEEELFKRVHAGPKLQENVKNTLSNFGVRFGLQ